MAYNSMSLHPNHMIKGLSCRQEARLQIISLLLNMVLTYTCAIFKTTKTYKTLHQFYGSLYNEPVDHILVWSNTNYFWFILLPQISREIHFFLEDGDRVYFLEWFSLNHTKFELTFSEVHRLSTPSEETLSWPLVVTLSKEYTYHWSSSSWEITLDNLDHQINNPAHYTLPPQNPQDSDFVQEQLQLQEEEYRLILARIDELDTTTSGWSTPPAPRR